MEIEHLNVIRGDQMLYNSQYRLTPQNTEFYCKRFKVIGPVVKGHHVYVYAECSTNPIRNADSGSDYLDIFFSADHHQDTQLL